MTTDIQEEQIDQSIEDVRHLHNVLRHINRVREDTYLLGTRLIEGGETQLGIDLIGLGLIHDASKIHNQLEFRHLRDDQTGTPEFKAALLSHVSTNLHHPEAWNGIEEMPRVYVAEMVCDWKARSSEFGSDVMEWVKKRATGRFGFSTSGKVYKEIKEFFGILLDKPFS